MWILLVKINPRSSTCHKTSIDARLNSHTWYLHIFTSVFFTEQSTIRNPLRPCDVHIRQWVTWVSLAPNNNLKQCQHITYLKWNFSQNSNLIQEIPTFEKVMCKMVVIFVLASVCWHNPIVSRDFTSGFEKSWYHTLDYSISLNHSLGPMCCYFKAWKVEITLGAESQYLMLSDWRVKCDTLHVRKHMLKKCLLFQD